MLKENKTNNQRHRGHCFIVLNDVFCKSFKFDVLSNSF